jgi:site-specific DNA recombinase
MYLNNEGEPNPENGGGSPSYFVSRRVMMISPVDIKMYI